MAKKTKSGYFVPLNEEQIIAAVSRVKNPGSWRYATWIHEIMTIGSSRDEIVITYSKSCRIGIHYDKMQCVIEAKEAEDAAIGVPKERRESSYIHMKDEKGNLVDPIYIVRARTDTTRKYLQVMKSNQHKLVIDELGNKTFPKYPTTVRYYKNGVEIDPAKEKTLMAVIKATCKVDKASKGETPTWVLPFDKVLEIH